MNQQQQNWNNQQQPFPPMQDGQMPPNMYPQGPQRKKRKFPVWAYLVIGFVVVVFLCSIFGDDVETEPASDTDDTALVEEEKPTVDLETATKLQGNFKRVHDEFKNIDWVYPKSFPKYDNITGVYTYFAEKDSVPTNFRLRIQYGANDWLFIQKYIFLIDGKTYEFSCPKMERDNDHRIWEWSDTGVDSDIQALAILSALVNAKEAKVRFEGRQYHQDYTLKPAEIKAITETFQYYTALGGR